MMYIKRYLYWLILMYLELKMFVFVVKCCINCFVLKINLLLFNLKWKLYLLEVYLILKCIILFEVCYYWKFRYNCMFLMLYEKNEIFEYK